MLYLALLFLATPVGILRRRVGGTELISRGHLCDSIQCHAGPL